MCGNDIMNVFDSFNHFMGSAFDPNNHGVFSGSWDDFPLGVNRLVGLGPSAVTNTITGNLKTYASAIGESSNSILTPLSMNPSFYIIAIGGILVLIIGGYVAFKVLKYV